MVLMSSSQVKLSGLLPELFKLQSAFVGHLFPAMVSKVQTVIPVESVLFCKQNPFPFTHCRTCFLHATGAGIDAGTLLRSLVLHML